MNIMKNKKVRIVFSVVVLIGLMVPSIRVGAISLACRNSAACREAAAKEEEANRNAAKAESSANAYQMKVNELSVVIAGKEAEIAETEVNIKELKQKIEETEEKLQEEQEALATLLVNMHFESDAEPIKVLAGANSISDLAEKAAREAVAKEQISVSANNVKETKVKLEADKAEVEDLLGQQKSARASLVSKQAEQKELVEKYENDAEAYTEIAKEQAAKKRAAEEAEQKKNPNLYGGGRFYSGANTYYWQDRCPEQQDWGFSVYPGIGVIGGYLCECTSYAGWKAFENYGIVISFWGDAKSWDGSAKRRGYSVDHDPAAGTIGQFYSGPYGHVFWVESVNADGSINISEYNNYWSTGQLTGSYHMGDFGSQTISAAQARSYNYIHLK
ncbi:CHAP domain-containing protein [Candidatus Saccharibacteria bacterium]|nr:CHAP domain-containing protein [Candidatus Saccharibacteria bacterium]